MNKSNLESRAWQTLCEKDLAAGDLPVESSIQSLWYLRVMQGVAGWFAALFLLGFVGIAFTSLFRAESALLLLVIGLGFNFGAFQIFRINSGSEFINQLGLVVSITGQFMVAFAIGFADIFDADSVSMWLLLAVYQGGLALLMHNYLHRVLSSWFTILALGFGLNLAGASLLLLPFGLLLFTLLWSQEYRWGKLRSVFNPIGYGIALALIQISGTLLAGDELIREIARHSQSTPLFALSEPVQLILFVPAVLLLLHSVVREYRIDHSSTLFKLMVAGSVLVLLINLKVPGVVIGLVLLIQGVLSQRKVMIALGVASLVCLLSWFYYSLHETLLIKSLYLMALGGICILIRYAMVWYSKKDLGQQPLVVSTNGDMKSFKLAILSSVLFIFCAVNWGIYEKEHHLAHGDTVLLELAPVDPRSLMQGDFMRLRFAVQNDAFGWSRYSDNHDGFIVVAVDEDNVGHWSRFDDGTPLAEGELRLQYRIRNKRIKFATNAFFFEEGQAAVFDRAKYGEFKVNADGGLLLHAMRDESFKVLGISQP